MPLEYEAVDKIGPYEKTHIILYQDRKSTPEKSDGYVSIHILIPRGEGYQRVVVSHRKLDTRGNPNGRQNANPLLDTWVYEFELSYR